MKITIKMFKHKTSAHEIRIHRRTAMMNLQNYKKEMNWKTIDNLTHKLHRKTK